MVSLSLATRHGKLRSLQIPLMLFQSACDPKTIFEVLQKFGLRSSQLQIGETRGENISIMVWFILSASANTASVEHLPCLIHRREHKNEIILIYLHFCPLLKSDHYPEFWNPFPRKTERQWFFYHHIDIKCPDYVYVKGNYRILNHYLRHENKVNENNILSHCEVLRCKNIIKTM